ncbi:MAG: 3-oxoacyl-[acyl-carrier-protein] reductase [Pseudobdellovibrionaceae bacterium]
METTALQGKKIFVTGGSRGIGATLVKWLASRGAQVAFTYSSSETQAQEVLKSLSSSGHFCLQMNVADEASVTQVMTQVLERLGGLDGVVNNAGVTSDGLLLRMKTEDFDKVINTNLRGTFLVTRAAIKPMVKARAGSIVNITSVIGQMGNAGQANYAASKAGIEAFSKSVAQELGSRGIRVNCIAPGFIATEMTGVLSDDVKAKILGKIPQGIYGTAEDVAACVGFLLSDESKYVTGHTMSVNGGMFMN